MHEHKESKIKSFLFCSAYQHLGGEINFHPSQKLLFKALKDFYLAVIKDQIKNFDKTLNDIIKRSIGVFYPELKSIDDIQYLFNWTLSLMNDFFQFFTITKYEPIITNHQPIISHKSALVSLDIDILLSQNNKMQFLHGVYFVPKVDAHYQQHDLFGILKLKYLKEVYAKRKYNTPPVKIHCISVEPASFRNRNKRNYKLTKFTKETYTYKEQERCRRMLDYYIRNKDEVIPKISCELYSCTKRLECSRL